MNANFMRSEKNTLILIFDNQKFYRNSKLASSGWSWLCSKARSTGCGMRVYLDAQDRISKVEGGHNHPLDGVEQAQATTIYTHVKDVARATEQRPSAIIADAADVIDERHAAILPKIEWMKRCIRDVRVRQNGCYPFFLHPIKRIPDNSLPTNDLRVFQKRKIFRQSGNK